MTSTELNELLEQADRSKAWLARKLGVAERTVQRWADPESPWPVPSARDDRIRAILEPSTCSVCGALRDAERERLRILAIAKGT